MINKNEKKNSNDINLSLKSKETFIIPQNISPFHKSFKYENFLNSILIPNNSIDSTKRSGFLLSQDKNIPIAPGVGIGVINYNITKITFEKYQSITSGQSEGDINTPQTINDLCHKNLKNVDNLYSNNNQNNSTDLTNRSNLDLFLSQNNNLHLNPKVINNS